MTIEFIKTEELGITTAKVINILKNLRGFHDDPITILSGCGDEFAAPMTHNAYNDIVGTLHEAGFKGVQEFINLCKTRAGARWMYEQLGELEQMHEEFAVSRQHFARIS